jgi:hypothetical protein
MHARADTGGIKPTENLRGTIDKFLDRVPPRLVLGARYYLHTSPKTSELIGKALRGIADHKIVIATRHFTRKRGHHVRIRVREYRDTLQPVCHRLPPTVPGRVCVATICPSLATAKTLVFSPTHHNPIP